MRIPLLSGIMADENAEFLQSYPLNLEPVTVDSGIAKGQLRAPSGATVIATGLPGLDRGGTYIFDTHLRVMGSKLVLIKPDNSFSTLGDVGTDGLPVSFAIGPDRLGIRSGTDLYYWDNANLTHVTDVDLGQVNDVIWIDGYFMTTDGTSVVVTELNDPTSVSPLKYGSAEEDPDPITGLIKWRDEAHVLGRYTIQVFRNLGTTGFPFVTIPGATIPVGCVGPMAKCLFAESFAFVGSARNQGLAIYVAGSGTADRISTRAIEDELALVEDPSSIILENRTSRSEARLLVHLPTKTLVFLYAASQTFQTPVWYVAESGLGNPYRVRGAVRAYGRTIVADTQSAQIGNLDDTICSHFGEAVQWRFDMGLLSNNAKGGIIHSLELVGLPGRAPGQEDGRIFLSLTRDGISFTTERAIAIGREGQHFNRLQWRPRTNFRNYIGFRVRGYTTAMPGFAACEAEITPLAA